MRQDGDLPRWPDSLNIGFAEVSQNVSLEPGPTGTDLRSVSDAPPCVIHDRSDSAKALTALMSAPKSTPLGRPASNCARMTRRRLLGVPAALAALRLTRAAGAAANARQSIAMHAIAMHGEPALAPGFAAFRYVNPDAPKGGRLVQGVLGSFDSLKPFIVKGLALPQLRGLVFENLMARGYDEPFTLYGLLAQSIETDSERTTVTFTLDPRAAFADGRPVTADDVIFSWQVLRDHGRPNFRTYYVKIADAMAVGRRAVKFDLAGADDRELPLIL